MMTNTPVKIMPPMNEPVSNRRPPPLFGFFVVVEVEVVGCFVGWVLDMGAGLELVGTKEE